MTVYDFALKTKIPNVFNQFGYDIIPIPSEYSNKNASKISNQASGKYFDAEPPNIDPIWALPRASKGMSDDKIRAAFSKYAQWHYAFAFDGGLSFPARHNHPSFATI